MDGEAAVMYRHGCCSAERELSTVAAELQVAVCTGGVSWLD